MNKKLLAIAVASLVLTGTLAGCANKTPADETSPAISGNQISLVCEAGKQLNLLDGITAVDDVDGDLTSSVTVSVEPELAVSNGVVSPQKGDDGEYEVKYTVSDKAGNVQYAYSTLVVTKALAEKVLVKQYDFGEVEENPFSVYFDKAVEGTAAAERGNYKIKTTKVDGTDWHIKYEGNLENTVKGAEYKVIYSFVSNVEGKVRAGGKDFDIKVGANEITGTYNATEETLYTELQLGLLPVFEIEMTSVKVVETIGTDVWDNVNVKTFNENGVASQVFDNNSTGTLATTADDATLTITKGSDENGVWQTKLVLAPGVDLVKDGKYEISVDIEAEKDIDQFEVLYGTQSNDKAVSALYGQKAKAGEKKTLTWSGKVDSAANDLHIVFQLGKQNVKGEGNVIKVSNLVVKKAVTEDTTVVTGADIKEVENDFWSGSAGSSVKNADNSVTLTVTKGTTNPNVWELKQKIWTEVALQANRTYVASIDVTSDVALPEFEALLRYNKTENNIDGAWRQTTNAGEKKHIEFEFTTTQAYENVGFVFQLGKLQSAATVTFSDFTIVAKGGSKEVKETQYTFTPKGLGTYNSTENGAAGSLYTLDGKLIYDITAFGETDWYNKMYISKITLEEGKIYTFEFEAKADKEITCAWFLNVCGSWDPRLQDNCTFKTEYQTYTLTTTAPFAAEINFEVLWQFGDPANKALGGAKIEFKSLAIYSQDAE